MTATLPELVEQLAAISLVDEVEDLDRLAVAMAKRQELLTAIQNADTSTLDSELRAAVNDQLEELLAHDAELLAYLCGLREDTLKALEKLQSGRAAVRGYGGTLESTPPPSRRFG